ncbi:MAG: amino acid transporter substrate-binding protein [Frankiales bacterium]|jgi:ABC-type branched-subunit amino acid transport system substrate-binding protein|nr:amino acid transporter substrate-binding protein [Frankiales bacterium]
MVSPARSWRMLAAISASSLALAACGGGGDDTASGGDDDSAAKGDGTLTIGSLLPQTGNLAFLGPPEFAGVELALKEVNDGGGVNGKPVTYIEGDSGDAQQDVANPTVDRLLAAKADVIVGAASSGVSFTVVDKITSAGAVMYSPANTSPKFTDYADKGLYFRTAPSDVLQGRILGETILADGHQNVGILALQDPYGEGLADNIGSTVTDAGAKLAPESAVFYDPAASNFDAQVNQVKAANPDAIVLIGFEESAKVIQSMVAAGIGPQQVPLYLVDGNLGNALGEDLPAGLLKGTKGSLPGAEATTEFREKLKAIDPALKDFSYAPESYDAVITSALAAIAAGDDSGEAIAKELPGVTKGGEKCTTFEQCKTLLEDDKDIDYDGVSGPIELSEKGDPTSAIVGIYTFGPDNKLTTEVDYQPGELE